MKRKLQTAFAPRHTLSTTTLTPLYEAVLHEALTGLSAPHKTLTPWLFYDELGSQLFEQITSLPEYYLTRTERSLFITHAAEILRTVASPLTIAELGAGSASKTGILLQAAVAQQGSLLYQPIDVSPTALDEASATLSTISGLTIQPLVANYITEPYTLTRPPLARILALYIGSSIGNFAPHEATQILRNLRSHLAPGDALLLGTDLAPNQDAFAHNEHKSVATLLAAYDDAAGVTAAFNRNILTRLNRDLNADFNLNAFAHRARWNPSASRIEMHLESLTTQTVTIPTDARPVRVDFAQGETIHTENSYKFTPGALTTLFTSANFNPTRTFHDKDQTFAVTLATAL
jgi:L-histidine N-alpha-methyltransferase